MRSPARVASLLLVLVLASCGGGDSTSPGGTSGGTGGGGSGGNGGSSSAPVSTNQVGVSDDIFTPVNIQIARGDRKSTRLNSSHSQISYAVFCLKKKKYA